jgi:2-polyprenyl-3-methyl-5-hydroxy-6-metoxy-1,4-benzoquinol methylase
VSSAQSESPSRVSTDQGSGGQAVAPVAPEIAIRRSLGLYSAERPGTRGFVWARHVLCPLAPIAAEIPPRGRVLDVGCGHGLFANALALGSPARTVLGIDPSAVKIDVARRSAARLPNISYSRGVVQALADGGFDAISILDVLYLLPVEEKLAVLRACRERIADDGVLVVKANDTRPSWKYVVARLQEQVMTTVGLTMGHGLYFLSREQNAALLELAGFKPSTIVLKSWLPYPHVMFVSRPA